MTDVFEWTCPVPNCGKEISTLHAGQLAYLSDVHSLTHKKRIGGEKA